MSEFPCPNSSQDNLSSTLYQLRYQGHMPKDAFIEKSVILVCWINWDNKSTETWSCWNCVISDVCSISFIKLFGVYYGFPYLLAQSSM